MDTRFSKRSITSGHNLNQNFHSRSRLKKKFSRTVKQSVYFFQKRQFSSKRDVYKSRSDYFLCEETSNFATFLLFRKARLRRGTFLKNSDIDSKVLHQHRFRTKTFTACHKLKQTIYKLRDNETSFQQGIWLERKSFLLSKWWILF